MKDEWSASEPCPVCGGETKWVPSHTVIREGKPLEVGRLHCESCEAESDVIEIAVNKTSSNVHPVFPGEGELSSPVPLTGRSGKVAFEEILKRIVKEVHDAKVSEGYA